MTKDLSETFLMKMIDFRQKVPPYYRVDNKNRHENRSSFQDFPTFRLTAWYTLRESNLLFYILKINQIFSIKLYSPMNKSVFKFRIML